MANPKRTSDSYIHLNKKIVDKPTRNIISILAKEWNMTEKQVCYEFIRIKALEEIEKRKILNLKKVSA